MTDLYRQRVIWTGFNGAPGVSTLYGLVSGGLGPDLHTLLTACAGAFPTDVHMLVESSGDVIDDSTGALVGSWTGSTTAAVVGTSGSAYAAPAGWAATWLTGTVVGGKRLKGRTYMVPGAGGMYQTDGSIEPVILGDLQGWVDTFVSASVGDLVVWHRPKGGLPGTHGLVTSGAVHDKVVVLRSRRD